MFHIRNIGTSVMAILITSLAAAAGASASDPEFKPSAKTPFIGSSGSSTLESSLGEKISCTHGLSLGEVQGASRVGKVVVSFTGCTGKEGEGSVCSVKSSNGKTGEILTHALDGELGLVAKAEAASGIGLLLLPETTKEFVKPEGTCLITAPIEGSVAAEMTQLNVETGKTSKLIFSGTSGSQNIQKIVVLGATLSPKLVGFGLVSTSYQASEELTFGGIGWFRFLAPEEPYKLKQNVERTVLAEFSGAGNSGKITVTVVNGPEFTEVAGGSCQGNAGISSNTTCTIKLKCTGPVGSKGKVTVSGAATVVFKASEALECI